MKTLKLSPRFELTIPKWVRERMNLQAGIKFEIICFEGRIELIPLRPMSEMRGFLKGLDLNFIREKTDRI